MKSLLATALTTVLALGSFAGAGAQQYPQYPYPNTGQYGQNNGQYGRYGRNTACTSGNQYNNGRHRGNDNDNDNDNDRDDGGYNNGRYNNGRYNNSRNGNCGNSVVRGTIVGVNSNLVTIAMNAAPNGQYGGQYGQNGQYGQYGRNNRTLTIDDQPALNNQTTGRVSVGRYVTAYGYWQNGQFFATRLR